MQADQDIDTTEIWPSAGIDGEIGAGTPPSQAPSDAASPTSTVTAGPIPAKSGTTAPPNPGGGSGTGLRNGSWAGGSVTHKYGTLKVSITISGGKITAITESYTTSLQVSEQINRDTLPKLRQKALIAQSASSATARSSGRSADLAWKMRASG